VYNGKQANWVAGANLITDHFTDAQNILSYDLTTIGLFAQNTYRPASWFSLESGIRVDYNTPAPQNHTNGVFVLPRINALFKLSKQLSSRIGGGLGYKMPTVFNDESEQEGYQHIQPLNINNTQAEQSYGLNGDVNYRGAFGDAFISVNQLFFYTHVNHPLILVNNAFINSTQPITSRGAETNIKLTMDELGFYFGYTYTDARINNSQLTLTPKHRFSFDSTYEIENSFRFGVESFYNSSQFLSDGTTGRAYITFGMLIQKMWKHLDIFINAENLTDQRQTRWGSIYSGSITNPDFLDIYAPLDGVVVNAGIRIKLLN
jgi:outer membrane receptor for ferrienterochelin and colicins